MLTPVVCSLDVRLTFVIRVFGFVIYKCNAID